MKKTFSLFAILAIFSLLLLGGCTTQVNNYYTTEGGEVLHGNIIDKAALDANKCETGDCTCFVCKNETPSEDSEFYNEFSAIFFDYTLEGGRCEFRSCTEEEFVNGFSDSPDMHTYFFMAGQGSTFGEFAEATTYCNNSLRMAVKWLSSREGYDYPLPDEKRARCILNKNAIPMYVLYSDGKAINPTRAGQIAKLFKDSGPVILVAEMDFDPTNDAQLVAAAEEAKQMKANCPKCLIAIAPKYYYNDTYGYNATYDALDWIFTNSGAGPSIDLVALGLNSHHTRSCRSAETIQDAVLYANYSLQKYNKPSVWAYVLLDQDWNAGGAESGTCTWSESEITTTYIEIFQYSPVLVKTGIIGAAPYSLYGVQSGPLNCTNCGMMSAEGVRYPEHTIWFSQCQRYYTYRGAMPLVFTSKPGTDCSFGNNFNSYQAPESRTGDAPTFDELLGKEIDSTDAFFTCNGQLVTNIPEEITTVTGAYDASGLCDIYPMLDFFADVRDTDPVLTRAFAWSETGLDDEILGPGGDTCFISQVGKASYPNLPDEINDPSGICGLQHADTGKVFHSLGIMGVHMYPGYMWVLDPDYRVPEYEGEALWCGGEDYNPLNQSDNACLGTAIIINKLNAAKTVIATPSNEGKLGLTDLKNQYGDTSTKYQDMKNTITMFAAAYRYNGYKGYLDNEQSWINQFGLQREINATYCAENPGADCCTSDGHVLNNGCCGITNFIDYVNKCKNPSNKYATEVLKRYKSLTEDCDKYNELSRFENVKNYVSDFIEEEPGQVVVNPLK